MIDYEGLQKCRVETKQELLELIKKHDKVGCIRWTGFGKTYMLNELYHELPGKKLVITSTNPLKDEFLNKNCNCITYHYLYMNIEKILNQYNNIEYLFLDECHRYSTNTKWGKAVNTFISKINCKVIGVTATPDRLDGINVINTLFNNIQVKPVFLDEAHKLNYINELVYVRSYYNVEEIITKLSTMTDKYLISRAEIGNIEGIEEIIKKHYSPKKNGNKIIIFGSRVKELKDLENHYYKIFSKLFPEEKINTFISSHEDILNKELDKFRSETDGINIIFTVDKLGEGIHIENTNTVIFMRPTISLIKYFQQLGRGINNQDKESLIFDFANNCDKLQNIYRLNKLENPWQSGRLPLIKTDDLVTVYDYVSDVEKVFDIIRKKHLWSEEEIEILKNNSEKSTEELVELLPNKTKQSIRNKKYSLGINPGVNFWTKEEDEILKNNNNKPIEELMKLLPGRPEGSIKCRRLKIAPIRSNWTKEELKILDDNIDKTLDELMELLPQRPKQGIECKRRTRKNYKKYSWEWTKEEDEIVKNNIDKSIEELMRLLPNRTKEAIRGRRSKYSHINFWTENEEEILRDNVDKPTEKLMELLPNRTRSAILTRKGDLKLKKRWEWTKEEDEIVKNNIDKSIEELMRLLPNRTKKSIWKRKHDLREDNREAYKLWTKEEDEILKNNMDLSYNELMKLLHGRTRNSISGRKIYLMGSNPQHYWTKEEEEIVKNNYKLSLKRLSKLLPNRSLDSIRRKRMKLNLQSRKNYWTKEEDEIIKNNIMLPRNELLKLLPNRTLKSIHTRVHNLKRKEKK